MAGKIDFEVIPKLNDGERMVVYVEVGDLPYHIVIERLQSVRDEFKNRVTDNAIFVPMQNGKHSLEVVIGK